MFQHQSYGNVAKALLTEGQLTSSPRELKLGQYFEDGINRYRWARVISSGHKVGQFVCFGQGNLAKTATSGYFRYVSVGKGNAVGDTIVQLYSAAILSNPTRFQGGTMEVVSGQGSPFIYKINTYETGAAGKYSKLFLESPLRAKLSTTGTTKVVFRPNPYDGVKVVASVLLTANSAIPAGVLTASGSTSGYQWIQDQGIACVKANVAVVEGYTVGIGESGLASTAFNIGLAAVGSNCVQSNSLLPVGKVRGTVAADSYVSCKLMIPGA